MMKDSYVIILGNGSGLLENCTRVSKSIRYAHEMFAQHTSLWYICHSISTPVTRM